MIEKIRVNGIELAYLSEGQGPLALLVHGFPDTPYTWDHVRPLLAQRGYRAVTPWTRGYAPSGIPDRDADAETLARDVLGLIEALGEKQAVVIGHDWGAFAAYGAAALAPERVKQLFTVAIPHPMAIKPTLSAAWKARHFVAYKLPGAARRFAADDFAALRVIYKRWSPTWDPSESEFSAVRHVFSDPKSLEAALGYYRALSFRPPAFLKKPIAVPTVTFAGTDDSNLSVEVYHQAARFFSAGYTVETMPGGHFLHREHPQLFAEKLLSHL